MTALWGLDPSKTTTCFCSLVFPIFLSQSYPSPFSLVILLVTRAISRTLSSWLYVPRNSFLYFLNWGRQSPAWLQMESYHLPGLGKGEGRNRSWSSEPEEEPPPALFLINQTTLRSVVNGADQSKQLVCCESLTPVLWLSSRDTKWIRDPISLLPHLRPSGYWQKSGGKLARQGLPVVVSFAVSISYKY